MYSLPLVCRVEIEERMSALKLMERQLSDKEKELVEVGCVTVVAG